jgi:hypothetical protein
MSTCATILMAMRPTAASYDEAQGRARFAISL